MGMTALTTKLLMEQSKHHDFRSAHLLTIGRQGITFSVKELVKWARELEFQLVDSHLQRAVSENRMLTDTEYFLSLGFKSVDSMDVSEYEQATIICNLNEEIPQNLRDKFDVIYDGGSTEHMFNVPKALENYNKMLKIGGLMMHALPSTGNMDHGFYMFSPTFFYDYYSQNRWCIDTKYMIQMPYSHMNTWSLYEYSEPGPFLEHIEFKGRWGVFFVAQKKPDSTYNNNIAQTYFRNLWKHTADGKLADSGTTDGKNLRQTGLLIRLFRMLPERIKTLIRSLVFKMKNVRVSKPRIPFKKKSLI